MVRTLDDLRREAIKRRLPNNCLEENYCTDSLDNSYTVNGEIVIFICNNIAYMVPYNICFLTILWRNEFLRKNLPLSFSLDDFSEDDICSWNILKSMSTEAHMSAFAYDCERFADRKGINPLRKDLLKKCVSIPKDGLLVAETMYYPQIISSSFTVAVAEKLGLYTKRDGVVVFIYRDGQTYISSYDEDLERFLILNGYEDSAYLGSIFSA